MTAEQLEELLGKAPEGPWHWVNPDDDTPWDGNSYMLEASLRTVREYDDGRGVIIPKFIIYHAEEIGAEDSAAHTLIALAPSLARRVIAAEKLVDDITEILNGLLVGEYLSYYAVAKLLRDIADYREASK